jgi:phosphoserine phosphatase
MMRRRRAAAAGGGGPPAPRAAAWAPRANDLKMMAEAGISIAYRAKPVVREKANYALNQVGLEGVVPLLGAG